MTFSLHLWMVPALITIGMWIYCAARPSRGGDYNFGAAVDAFIGLSILLAVWLIYFATAFFTGVA